MHTRQRSPENSRSQNPASWEVAGAENTLSVCLGSSAAAWKTAIFTVKCQVPSRHNSGNTSQVLSSLVATVATNGASTVQNCLHVSSVRDTSRKILRIRVNPDGYMCTSKPYVVPKKGYLIPQRPVTVSSRVAELRCTPLPARIYFFLFLETTALNMFTMLKNIKNHKNV